MESMTIQSIWREEKKIIHMLDRLLCDGEFYEADCLDLKTAVVEVCLNAMEHGNCLIPERNVEVVVCLADDTVVVTVADQGSGYSFLSEAADMDHSHSERGLGIMLMQALVDKWTFFCRTDTRQFVVKLEKQLNKRERG